MVAVYKDTLCSLVALKTASEHNFHPFCTKTVLYVLFLCVLNVPSVLHITYPVFAGK